MNWWSTRATYSPIAIKRRNMMENKNIEAGTPKRSYSMWAWGYNEEDMVEEFLEKSTRDLERVTDDYEIIVVDDGSTDGTWQVMQECAKKYPKLKVVRHDKNMQWGECFKTCQKNTTDKDIVFWNTVDMFFDTSKLPEFVKELDKYDVVQGVRSDRKSNTYKSFYRRMNSAINYNLIKMLFNVPIHDFQNVTFSRWSFLKDVHYDSSSSFTNPECVIKAYYSGKRIKEVLMKHMDRKKGKAKGGRPSAVLHAVRDIFKCFLLWKVLRRVRIEKGEVVSFDEE